MITTFRAYRGDEALLVTEDGLTMCVPMTILDAAGLRTVRTGQRLLLELGDDGLVGAVRLP